MVSKVFDVRRASAKVMLILMMFAQTSQAVPYDEFMNGGLKAEDQAPQGVKETIKKYYQRATVLETLEASSYTFMKLKTSSEEVWAATTTLKVKANDVIAFAGPLVMEKFHSKTLDRTFDKILFLSDVKLHHF